MFFALFVWERAGEGIKNSRRMGKAQRTHPANQDVYGLMAFAHLLLLAGVSKKGKNPI
jgi:hypothetical protein